MESPGIINSGGIAGVGSVKGPSGMFFGKIFLSVCIKSEASTL